MSTNTQARYVPPHLRFDESQITRNLSAMELSLYNQSPIFRRLLRVKREFGNDPSTEARFQARRALYAEGVPDDYTVFRDQFEQAMDDINHQSGGALLSVRKFLDLGCAPGGFSTWVLRKNEMSRGVGVTIGMEKNGWGLVQAGWEESMVEQYQYVEADICDQVAWTTIQDKINGMHTCDLVIAGAIWRAQDPEKSDGDLPANQAERTRLRISQLVLALRNLSEGGCLVAVMSLKPSAMTVTLLLLLKQNFERTVATKGKTLHRMRSSYYLVCQGRKSDINDMVGKLENAMAEEFENAWSTNWLGFLGDGGKASLTSSEEREVLDHLEPMWENQAEAIKVAWTGQSGSGRGRGSKRGGRGSRGRARGAPAVST